MGAAEPAIAQDQSFAAIAVELHVAKSTFADMALAAAIFAMLRNGHLEQLERVAADCGIKSHTVHDLLLDEKRLSSLVAEAHRLFKRMVPIEGQVRALIERLPA